MFTEFLYLLGLVVFLSFTLIFIRILFADGDLVVIHKRLRQEYFRDRVVWVTGASSGIGEAIARQLSSLGAMVILSSRSADKLEAVRDSLHRPQNARVLEVDVSDTANAEAAAEQAVQQFGHVDMLINCAGISQRGLHSDFSLDVERRLLEVDFFGAVALTKAILPHLVSRGSGHICNISSVLGKMGGPGRAAYSAAKYALLGYMDALRVELLGLGHTIAVTTVCPGPVATNCDVNSLGGDGSPLDVTDPVIRGGMAPARCAHLTLVAVSRHLAEAWICTQPILLFTYMVQYVPTLYVAMSRLAAKALVKEMALPLSVEEKKKS